MSKPFKLGLIVAVISVAIDQIFKINMVEFMAGHPYGIEVTSFFRLVMVWNSGVSFGMFSGGEQTRLFLIAISTVISLILLVWLYRSDRKFLSTGIGLVLGGAVGNIIDRIHYGRVADFFDFDLYFMRWPAFNIADIAIVCGVAILLVDSLFFDEKSTKNEA
ncbi:signal peptidase II [Sneathiella sp. P13V-1]|uniref:signal peptidase II n=1 Tax=Sneathiella sp. P13V-1 TaxID=2697366 RepID=UPI00187B3124|nr:signal peptidase II [Sneathiella sp. P13V-1]MBE7638496.1 signal peptidase II [Sneathiella sp. P13V-1]